MGLSLALYEKDFSVLDKGGRGGEEGRGGNKDRIQGEDSLKTCCVILWFKVVDSSTFN